LPKDAEDKKFVFLEKKSASLKAVVK